MGNGPEVVLSVDEGEGLDEHEDEGVTESGEEGECEDNGFSKKHLERTGPSDEDLLDRESPPERRDFIGAPDVGIAFLASPLGDSVHHDCSSGLRDEKKVSELNGAAKNQLRFG